MTLVIFPVKVFPFAVQGPGKVRLWSLGIGRRAGGRRACETAGRGVGGKMDRSANPPPIWPDVWRIHDFAGTLFGIAQIVDFSTPIE
ncbi:MAG: hypothetical protein D6812_14630 [Deltaproteobacteria bacterium]|nr:MAG: hypothetical protein D6812_14630 [Deltaproteobacteria bacterium]